MISLLTIAIAVAVCAAGAAAAQVAAIMSRKKRAAKRSVTTLPAFDYDVIVVGGSIAGPVAAKCFSDQGRKVLVIERDGFVKPDRIVGELLQPGGLNLLESIGMRHCATEVGMPCTGYVTIHNGKWVQLPYRDKVRGVSFHFGDFVQNLRKYLREKCAGSVTLMPGSVNEVLVDGDRAIGVEYTPKGDVEGDGDGARKKVYAPLVVMCDGGSSKWKGVYQHYTPPAKPHSHFVGVIVRGMTMPIETRGHVFLGKSGPILSYRLDSNEVRILAAYTGAALPRDVRGWLLNEVLPQLPTEYHKALTEAVDVPNNVKSMPIHLYQAAFPAIRNYVGLGDHANQRHPLTGGGMTVAMRDAVSLAAALKDVKSFEKDHAAVHDAILAYVRHRNRHSSTINILSWALYAVFSGPTSMRTACFAYFELGGDCVDVPMALLSGLNSSGLVLLYHYARVMIYGAWILMYRNSLVDLLTFFVNPLRLWDAVYLLGYSTYVFAPLVWMEFVSVWRVFDPTRFLPKSCKH